MLLRFACLGEGTFDEDWQARVGSLKYWFSKFQKLTHECVRVSATRKSNPLGSQQSFDSPRTFSGDKYFMKTNKCIQLKFLGETPNSLLFESPFQDNDSFLFESIFSISTHIRSWCHGVEALFTSEYSCNSTFKTLLLFQPR